MRYTGSVMLDPIDEQHTSLPKGEYLKIARQQFAQQFLGELYKTIENRNWIVESDTPYQVDNGVPYKTSRNPIRQLSLDLLVCQSDAIQPHLTKLIDFARRTSEKGDTRLDTIVNDLCIALDNG